MNSFNSSTLQLSNLIAAVHFENLLFLVFIGIAFFFQLLMRAATKSNKGPDQQKPQPRATPPPIPQSAPPSDEDRIRRFLEALGQPAGSAPPPPVKPRPTYQKPVVLPHVPPFKSPLPPLTTRPPDLPREKKIFQPRPDVPTFEVHQAPPPIETAPLVQALQSTPGRATAETEPKRSDLMELLRSPSGLRDAIILREIFGPPRSMHPLDLV